MPDSPMQPISLKAHVPPLRKKRRRQQPRRLSMPCIMPTIQEDNGENSSTKAEFEVSNTTPLLTAVENGEGSCPKSESDSPIDIITSISNNDKLDPFAAADLAAATTTFNVEPQACDCPPRSWSSNSLDSVASKPDSTVSSDIKSVGNTHKPLSECWTSPFPSTMYPSRVTPFGPVAESHQYLASPTKKWAYSVPKTWDNLSDFLYTEKPLQNEKLLFLTEPTSIMRQNVLPKRTDPELLPEKGRQAMGAKNKTKDAVSAGEKKEVDPYPSVFSSSSSDQEEIAEKGAKSSNINISEASPTPLSRIASDNPSNEANAKEEGKKYPSVFSSSQSGNWVDIDVKKTKRSKKGRKDSGFGSKSRATKPKVTPEPLDVERRPIVPPPKPAISLFTRGFRMVRQLVAPGLPPAPLKPAVHRAVAANADATGKSVRFSCEPSRPIYIPPNRFVPIPQQKISPHVVDAPGYNLMTDKSRNKLRDYHSVCPSCGRWRPMTPMERESLRTYAEEKRRAEQYKATFSLKTCIYGSCGGDCCHGVDNSVW